MAFRHLRLGAKIGLGFGIMILLILLLAYVLYRFVKRLVRRMALGKSLAVLEHKQPASGGFLEAAPLTSFVVMNLAGTGRTDDAATVASAVASCG